MTHRAARFLARLRGLFVQQTADRELSSELETHLELLTDRLIRQGMPPHEAAHAARRQFGNLPLLAERHREERSLISIASLLQDLRYGLRMLWKNRTIAAIAVISLALGIGANTAVFTIAKAALLDQLSVPHPEQLRLLAYTQPARSVIEHDLGDFYTDSQGRTVVASFSYPAYRALLAHDHSLGELFAFVDLTQFEHLSTTIDGHADVATGELVSGNFFERMQVQTVLGRPIDPRDDAQPGAVAVAVISDSFWRRRFAASQQVIGKTIAVNLVPVTIIGVAPPGFSGASRVQSPQDLFLPLSMQPLLFPRGEKSLLSDPDTWWIQIMGRLQPGIPLEQARSSLDVGLAQAIRSTMTVPKDRSLPRLVLLPGGRGWNYAAQQLEHPMPYLLALAGFVLLLSCVNVANLLLAHSSSRVREIGIRLALGAGKKRVIRQMLTESLCLSAAGGALGLLIGYAARNILPRLLSPSWETGTLSVRFDWRVFAFTCAVSLLTGLAFGVAPAWHSAGMPLTTALQTGKRSTSGPRQGFAGRMLVGLQVALCMVLLVSAGLFLKTLLNLRALDPGFNHRGLLLFALEPPEKRYPARKRIELLGHIEERIATLPGVRSVSLSREALLAGSGSNSAFLPAGHATAQPALQIVAMNWVGPDFLRTMDIPILNGRSFNAHDLRNSHKVAVINRGLALQAFGAANPLGVFFRTGENSEPIEIIGICADARYGGLRDDSPPTFYLLYTQQQDAPAKSMTFEVRTRGNPKEYVASIRDAIASVDKDLPLIDVRTQDEQIAAAIAPERSFAAVTAGFGILALALASIGVYGVVSSGVSRRTNEIGVRMALGARAHQILRMVIGEALLLTLAALTAGACAALFLTRLFSSFLFGLKPADLLTYGGAALLLILVATLATWPPARRAASIQPVEALRND